MKFTFDGYEIDIKVKNTRFGKSTDKETTLNFMNRILSWYYDSIKDTEDRGFRDLAEIQRERANELYNQLAKHGLYDNLY